jgi:hypothetical protein
MIDFVIYKKPIFFWIFFKKNVDRYGFPGYNFIEIDKMLMELDGIGLCVLILYEGYC